MTPSNTSHWNDYYAHDEAPLEPSSFARHCQPYVQLDQPLLDAGCGNGRDALFFTRQGCTVWALDYSQMAIEKLKTTWSSLARLHFLVGDLGNLSSVNSLPAFGTIYSRFVLHAITEDEERIFLEWSQKKLLPGSLLMIEARSVNSSLYGVGMPCGRDAFIHGHYRRFIRKNELEVKLKLLGFELLESVEAAGLAIYKDDDPVVIRIIARKPAGKLPRHL